MNTNNCICVKLNEYIQVLYTSCKVDKNNKITYNFNMNEYNRQISNDDDMNSNDIVISLKKFPTTSCNKLIINHHSKFYLITELNIVNKAGFNYDTRCHRIELNDNYSNVLKNLCVWTNNFSVKEEYGINAKQFANALFQIKSNPHDVWYELFTRVISSFIIPIENTTNAIWNLELDFDHGS